MVNVKAILAVASTLGLCTANVNADERLTMLQMKTVGQVAVNKEQVVTDSERQEEKMKSTSEKQLAFVEKLAKSMVGSNETIDDTAKEALHAIEDTLKNSLQILQDSHNTAVALLDTLAGRVRTCHSAFQDAKAENAESKTKVDEQKDTHKKCRTKLAGDIDDRNTKCDDLDLFVGGLTPPNCAIPDEDLTVYWRNYKGFHDNNYDTWKVKKDLCDAATTTGENTEDTCDGNQEDYESGLCALRLTVVSACETYGSCYSVSRSDFDSAVETITFQESQRKVEWTAIKKIECYIKILLSTEEISMEDIQVCVNLVPDVSIFDIVIPDVPAQEECDVSDVINVPCDDGFIQDYAGMPGLDNCQACPALPAHLQAVFGNNAQPQLTPSVEVQLLAASTGQAVTWLNQCTDPSDADDQKWQLRACTDETLCSTSNFQALGVPAAWGAVQPMKSGSVIAWFNVQSQRVADCAWGACSSQPYPPPRGHWGTPYQVWKVDTSDHTIIDDDNYISVGDTIAFTRMWHGQFSDRLIKNCNSQGTHSQVGGGRVHGGTLPSPVGDFEFELTVWQPPVVVNTAKVTGAMVVKMIRPDEERAVTWLNQCLLPEDADYQKWQLRSCTDPACSTNSAGLGAPSQWSDDQPLTTGQTIAWFSVPIQRVADCAGGVCSSQPFPPPGGHWGTPYKVWKVNAADHTIIDDGSEISLGDTVAFTRMWHGSWSNRLLTHCGQIGTAVELSGNNLPVEPWRYEFVLREG